MRSYQSVHSHKSAHFHRSLRSIHSYSSTTERAQKIEEAEARKAIKLEEQKQAWEEQQEEQEAREEQARQDLEREQRHEHQRRERERRMLEKKHAVEIKAAGRIAYDAGLGVEGSQDTPVNDTDTTHYVENKSSAPGNAPAKGNVSNGLPLDVDMAKEIYDHMTNPSNKDYNLWASSQSHRAKFSENQVFGDGSATTIKLNGTTADGGKKVSPSCINTSLNVCNLPPFPKHD